MTRSTTLILVDKSREACINAIETFNRVSSNYREETFAILMINAWELLLKARVMKENGGSVKSLHVYDYKLKKDGQKSKTKVRKLSKHGSYLTIGIDKAAKLVAGYKTHSIDQACIDNLEALQLIRDCSMHFVSTDPMLKKVLTQISLAAVKNYIVAAQKWFQISFSDLNIATLPLSFDLDQKEAEAVAKRRPAAVANFLKQIHSKDGHPTNSDYSYAIKIEFQIVKKLSDDALKANVVKDSADMVLSVDQDSVPAGYDWDYSMLTKKLKSRYSDFVQNSKYHNIRRRLEQNSKYCFERYLNPKKKTGIRQKWYNPNILSEFDKQYTKIKL